MTFAEAAMIMMSGGAVIQPITITENGTYTAPTGIDGYSPISVGVPDRYTEGYNKGYQEGYNDGCNDTKNIYEDIIKQIEGDLPPAIDDKGNEIPNAITPDNDDDLEKYLQAINFSSSDGGAVTVQGLGGADTSFTVECVKNYNADGTLASTGARITARNLLTGKTLSLGGTPYANFTGNNVTFKITDVSFGAGGRSAVYVYVDFYKNGALIGPPYGTQRLSIFASNVGGTSFKDSDSQWAVTQA